MILKNIELCEMELTQELSANRINTLTYLYQKAIEYLSAVGHEGYKVILDKMQDLLSREDIQFVLQQSHKPGADKGEKPSKQQNPQE